MLRRLRIALPLLILLAKSPSPVQASQTPAPPPSAIAADPPPSGTAEAAGTDAAPLPRALPEPPGTQDSLSRPKSRADTVLIVQRRFNHREQIIAGSMVMTCLALMLVVMNNYNPR